MKKKTTDIKVPRQEKKLLLSTVVRSFENEAFCVQKNERARRFIEKNGFPPELLKD